MVLKMKAYIETSAVIKSLFKEMIVAIQKMKD